MIELVKEAPSLGIMAVFAWMLLNMARRSIEHYQQLTSTLADEILNVVKEIREHQRERGQS